MQISCLNVINKMRVDVFLSEFGYSKSRSQSQRMIESGAVFVDGLQIKKSSEEIDSEISHSVEILKTEKYVSRGGLKLEGALERFKIDVEGLDAIDIGASTGGFTDCLLKRNVKSVVAVDSGVGQLDASIANDKRVTNIEKYNARELSLDIIPSGADIAVMDVSFISQTLIIPNISGILRENGLLVSLIKPQFEAGRGAIGKGGIVKDEKSRFYSIVRVRDSASASGLYMLDLMRSTITGGDGNVEYLAVFSKSGCPLTDVEIKKRMR